MSESQESSTRTLRIRTVHREDAAADLRSYHQHLAEQRHQLPRRETVFEQAERERAEQ